MNKFIWLNRLHSGAPNRTLFNVDNITHITGSNSGTTVYFDNENNVMVSQNLDVVAALLGMDNYNE